MTIVDDRPKTATFLWLDISRACNLACSHCYNGSGPDGGHGAMRREDWLNVLDQAAVSGVRMVQLIGGEPTMYPDFAELVDHALSVAHGDLHFGNITRQGPVLLDWETWGLAPVGHDAASLVTYAVQAPDTCARAGEELAELLDGPEGRFTELAVITETLHIIENGYHAEAQEPLRQRARELLETGHAA
jgi:Radical SAM superfamily/Phosphotransferase enzyme family/4Fe-4S single cluster domain